MGPNQEPDKDLLKHHPLPLPMSQGPPFLPRLWPPPVPITFSLTKWFTFPQKYGHWGSKCCVQFLDLSLPGLVTFRKSLFFP